MSNENTKKGRFNAIDAFIILLAIACIVTVAYRFVSTDESLASNNYKEYNVKFAIDSVRASAYPYLVTGDTVRLKSNGKTLGTLSGMNLHIPAVGAYNENGAEVLYPDIANPTYLNDTRYYSVGYITVKGEMTQAGLLVGGVYVVPNSSLAVVTEHIETTVRIISIDEK